MTERGGTSSGARDPNRILEKDAEMTEDVMSGLKGNKYIQQLIN